MKRQIDKAGEINSMAIRSIPVDQRVIDIDSRRFASVEKALVELITNSDESYARMERAGGHPTGQIQIEYERHRAGALLVLTDQAEGMSFERVSAILTYGGAHSPLARGEGTGRGYFGRGLKQAVYGLGHGWIETIRDGRYSRIELFRGDNGGYLYEDGGGDRAATPHDHDRLGIIEHGTRVSIVVENAHANISLFRTLVTAVRDNIYLRDILARREIELLNLQQRKVIERSGRVVFEEPPASVLLGPDQPGTFSHDGVDYAFTITLKRAIGVELTLKGDERTNGLVVISGMAALDCQLFEHENQTGTEYLFGTVRCPALIAQLGKGEAIISDEREGLNQRHPFVLAFGRAVSRMIAPHVLAEQEKLKHLERASTSDRTSHMIENLLHHMSQAATHDLGIVLPSGADTQEADPTAALRFSTPFYYRKVGHPFRVSLLIDPDQIPADAELTFDGALPETLRFEPLPATLSLRDLADKTRLEWTVVADEPARGEITVRAGAYWAWCEVVVAENATGHPRGDTVKTERRRRVPRDHGLDMFMGYEFRALPGDRARAIYDPNKRKIIINTTAPTVQLYVDGRGYFRDTARLLLAELFMDVISDELARRILERSGKSGDAQAFHAAKQEIVRKYGSDIHLSFLNR
ncbi:ATP-binding protein [Phaeovulum sp. NW3]|uniref:ATP-binding protein n=1 Tax=Phaeovulum sp. NW3 TaxID=2934933 RepID=UPI002020B14E